MTKLISENLLVVRLIFGILLVSIPSYAHAGVFSFVSGLFNKDNPPSIIAETNSQNMALLQATINSESNPSIGGGNITIVGDTALLPEVGPSGSMANISEQPAGDQISVYVVRKGDSLSQIAKMFGVSINTIIWANNLHKSLIKEGQTLVILPVSGVRHVVKKGETIKKIAKKYKGNIKEILQFNDLSLNSKLAIGDIIIIPDGDAGIYDYYGSRKSKKRRVFVKSRLRGTGGPSYVGYYIRPLIGGVISQGLHGYNAIDFAAPIGTPILASAPGQVIVSKSYGWNGGYGSYVVIKHSNGTQTLYAHASKVIVYVGQKVVRGQVIAYVGSTGKSTGPHIHFEVRGAKNPF